MVRMASKRDIITKDTACTSIITTMHITAAVNTAGSRYCDNIRAGSANVSVTAWRTAALYKTVSTVVSYAALPVPGNSFK